MKIYLNALFIILMFGNFYCQAQKVEYTIFKNTTFSIPYPKGWTIDTSRKNKVELGIYSPKESADDNFIENFTLGIKDFSEYENNIDTFINTFKDNWNKLGDSLNISKAFIKVGAIPYYKLIYESPKNGLMLKYLQAIWFVKDDLYVMTFVSEKNKFDAYRGKVEEIINLFESVK
ncbi:MAG: PsbP-related protein [Ferruginibacter sp.]